MEKAIQAATRIPGEAVKLLEVIRRAQEEASKAIAVVKKYLTEVEEGNKVVKNVLKETNAILSAATKVDKVAKRDQSNAAITKEECTELKQLTLDGFESVPLRVETQKGTRGSTAEALRETERLEALMKTAILSADNAVELATTEKSAAQAALQEATQELEAAKKKQQESEKQKEGILESEVSERDGEKGLNRPQQPDTTDATSNPPAGASLPTADGTADGEKLLAQHTDGSDVPAWVRAPLMLLLLLMACVAAW
ncbi:hypothetical protein DQ04_08421000 [Trypanosoma grayi]|uniref:hypothetical protein n=1 Tax=Trypanosoma grayi TaxID=71804 RepID=UPI0004F49C5C|nr:hypothetical protein DQ04_08421000 [Trypanosoma grayi]KEG07940.1 hypothetical protein DQ04_08421000 [Trypanosoma grayi]